MNATPDEEIGQRLQHVREQQNLNQSQAVRALRGAGLVWSQGTLSKVESGIRPVRLAELPAISKAFGVSQSELLAPEDRISSTLQRMRVVEVTTQEAYSDIRRRYLGAVKTRRCLQLLAELSEGRPGPYAVSWSSARFLRDGLRDEFSETGIAPEDALVCMGVDYVPVEEINVESEEDFEALKDSLPGDYRLAVDWKNFVDLRSQPLESKFNSLNHIREVLTDLAMGKALESKYPQVKFTATGKRRSPLDKEDLVITGIQESESDDA